MVQCEQSLFYSHVLAVLTAFLWWTYVDLKNNREDKDFTVPILEVDINNEKAFFYAAIVVSVLTVR